MRNKRALARAREREKRAIRKEAVDAVVMANAFNPPRIESVEEFDVRPVRFSRMYPTEASLDYIDRDLMFEIGREFGRIADVKLTIDHNGAKRADVELVVGKRRL